MGHEVTAPPGQTESAAGASPRTDRIPLPHGPARYARRPPHGAAMPVLVLIVATLAVAGVLGALLVRPRGAGATPPAARAGIDPSGTAGGVVRGGHVLGEAVTGSPAPVSTTPMPVTSTPRPGSSAAGPGPDPAGRSRVTAKPGRGALREAGALPDTRCRTDALNPRSATSVRRTVRRLTSCLDRAWSAELARAGFRFQPADWVVTAGGGRGACGAYPASTSGAPYYCPRDDTIYASTDAMWRGYLSTPGSYYPGTWTALFAREFGHHIQDLTGVLDSYRAPQHARFVTRMRAQAGCFAGMFMRSIADSYRISDGDREQLFDFFGDLAGAPAGQPEPGGWFGTGYRHRSAARCDAWTGRPRHAM